MGWTTGARPEKELLAEEVIERIDALDLQRNFLMRVLLLLDPKEAKRRYGEED